MVKNTFENMKLWTLGYEVMNNSELKAKLMGLVEMGLKL